MPGRPCLLPAAWPGCRLGKQAGKKRHRLLVLGRAERDQPWPGELELVAQNATSFAGTSWKRRATRQAPGRGVWQTSRVEESIRATQAGRGPPEGM